MIGRHNYEGTGYAKLEIHSLAIWESYTAERRVSRLLGLTGKFEMLIWYYGLLLKWKKYGIDVEFVKVSISLILHNKSQMYLSSSKKKFGFYSSFVYFWKCGKFCESNIMSLESPCVDLFNHITFIAFNSFWAKRWPSEYGWVTNQIWPNSTFSVLKIPL